MEETAGLPAALEAWTSTISQRRITSTYKLALAACLERFVRLGRVRVSQRELAEAFLEVYLARLVSSAGTGMPQLAHPTKRCVVERATLSGTWTDLSRPSATFVATSYPRSIGPVQTGVRRGTKSSTFLTGSSSGQTSSFR